MAAVDAGAQHMIAFLAGKTKKELFARAFPKKMLIAPVNNVADLIEDEHFSARDYWVEIDGRRQPGRFAKLSRTPLGVGAPPPTRDSANGVVQGDRRPAAPPVRAGARRGQPFAGIKVADFAWAGVGPIISKALADHGATVVHVESRKRLDVVRALPPFKDRVVDPDRAQMMANFNSSKLGLALDFANDRGRGVARRLIDWADVVVESFTAGTMARLGLGWDTISQGRPDLIMLSTTLRGQTGPYNTYGGYGNQGAAIAGIHGLTGWPDRAPAGPYGAYTDFIAPRFGVAALAAALYERGRSGRGQHIDLAQAEAAIHFIAPLVLDFTANGRIAGPTGHGSLECCPHGVYRAAGTERYLALSVETEAQWRGLKSVAPLAQFADPRFDAPEVRRAACADIDAALGAWCAEHEPFTLAERLRGAGVPAATVQWSSDLYRDPQVAHRGFFVTLDHTVMGPTPYDGPATRFSETPAHLRKAAPTLGEDTDHVLRDLLGMDAAEVAEHRAAGILV
jgi:crotonobetainyl-CoA:carnitine CoA-transferase CaiB-like acyl-CoA transferase